MPGSEKALSPPSIKAEEQKVKPAKQHQSEGESSENGDIHDCSDGKWSVQQNLKFVIFVHYHQVIFSSKRKRKICKIFKSLSEYLSTRNSTQCRSHFQKMMAKHKSINRLKKYQKNLMGINQYSSQLNQFKVKWEQTHQPMMLLYPQLKETKEYGMQTDQQAPTPVLCHTCQARDHGNQTVNSNSFISSLSPYSNWNSWPESMTMLNPGYYWSWMPSNWVQEGPCQ